MGIINRGAWGLSARGPNNGPSIPDNRNRVDSAAKKTLRLHPRLSSIGTRKVLSANWALPSTNDALTAPPRAISQP
jgi:hypothetical protein